MQSSTSCKRNQTRSKATRKRPLRPHCCSGRRPVLFSVGVLLLCVMLYPAECLFVSHRLDILRVSSLPIRRQSQSCCNHFRECPRRTAASSPFPAVIAANDNAAAGSASIIPTYRQLAIYIGATVIIWLSEPLLSLVDTTVIGMTQHGASGITQLASLGPATTLYDSLLYLTYFLAIATTNLLGPGRAQQQWRRLQRTTSHVLGVATALGIVAGLFCWTVGPNLIARMAGSVSGTPELLHHATRYMLLRSLASVPAVVGITAQAHCLACLDTTTPAQAVAAASVVNLVGDVLLCPRFGVQGAAVATAVASVVSCSILLRAVRRRVRVWRQLELEQAAATVSSTAMSPDDSTATAATQIILANPAGDGDSSRESVVLDVRAIPITIRGSTVHYHKIPMLSWPDRDSLAELLRLAGPIFFTILAKIACYGAMTIKCTDFGVVALAAHSIMMRVFFFYSCFGDAVSQAGQSYLPVTLYPRPQPALLAALLRRLVAAAAVIGVVNSQVSVLILQHGGRVLTQDGDILSMMHAHAMWIGAATLLHPFILMCEGFVIASRDFRTLVSTYAATVLLHFGILNTCCRSFGGIWRTFFLFQSIRLTNFGVHVLRQQRRLAQQRKTGSDIGPSNAIMA